MAPADFSPVGAVESGPSSNTGQKVREVTDQAGGALIDYLTIVLPREKAEARGLGDLGNLLGTIFGTSRALHATALREKSWQFYTLSSMIVDRDGELCGRIGVGGNRDTICISLSGAGTKWVRNWHTAHAHLTALDARISRVDVAYDDYDGNLGTVHALRERALAGEFASGGRPPDLRFLSDEGSGKGCTLYVGGKGHKEFCAYEKGRQLGMETSPWLRYEGRLYGKHAHVSLDVLLRPMDYLRGMYPVLANLLHGACQRLETIKRTVQSSAHAWSKWMRRQMGRSINLLRETFGDSWADYAEENLCREGRPARFSQQCAADELPTHLRERLCRRSDEPVPAYLMEPQQCPVFS